MPLGSRPSLSSLHFDLFGLGRLALGNGDLQDPVFESGLNLFLLNVRGQRQHSAEFAGIDLWLVGAFQQTFTIEGMKRSSTPTGSTDLFLMRMK